MRTILIAGMLSAALVPAHVHAAAEIQPSPADGSPFNFAPPGGPSVSVKLHQARAECADTEIRIRFKNGAATVVMQRPLPEPQSIRSVIKRREMAFVVGGSGCGISVLVSPVW